VSKGETTLCDGREILSYLSPETRRSFEERDVIYRRNYSREAWESVYQTDRISDVEAFCQANHLDLTVHPDGAISTIYRSSPVVRSPDGNAFVNSIMTFAAQEYLTGSKESQVRWSNNEEIDWTTLMEVKTVSDQLTTAHTWHAGDTILVDNTRVMHGRRSFNDDRRNILVRLGMLAH
jgi:alpha-ketoglutarate-dependent taurine dioxygenase